MLEIWECAIDMQHTAHKSSGEAYAASLCLA